MAIAKKPDEVARRWQAELLLLERALDKLCYRIGNICEATEINWGGIAEGLE
jgi:hypothetical protein